MEEETNAMLNHQVAVIGPGMTVTSDDTSVCGHQAFHCHS